MADGSNTAPLIKLMVTWWQKAQHSKLDTGPELSRDRQAPLEGADMRCHYRVHDFANPTEYPKYRVISPCESTGMLKNSAFRRSKWKKNNLLWRGCTRKQPKGGRNAPRSGALSEVDPLLLKIQSLQWRTQRACVLAPALFNSFQRMERLVSNHAVSYPMLQFDIM